MDDNIIEEYRLALEKASERLKIIYEEFGVLREWEEIHFIQQQILKKYNLSED
jgi:hypothetical protein